jgi:hypothetical protein
MIWRPVGDPPATKEYAEMAPLVLVVLAALAPTMNMSSTCHGEEKGLPSDQRASTYNTCTQAEQAAQTELNKKWSHFPAAAKQPCVALAGIFDSYVELLACIEIRVGSGLTSLPEK